MANPPLPSPREVALRFDSGSELRAAMLEVIHGARHALCWYTRDLEPPVTDDPDVLEALRSLSLKGRGTSIRVLLQDPTRAVRDGHRLIEMARRLSSVYALRRVHPEDLAYPSAFLVNDHGGFLFRTFGDRYEGEGHTWHPARCNQLLRYFNEVWERAEVPVELRALSL